MSDEGNQVLADPSIMQLMADHYVDYLQASSTVNYLEEWNLYLNTNEIMPDDIGIVGWWGVHHMLLFLFYHQSSQFSSYMRVTTQHGNHLLITTYQSWPLLSQVNGHFLWLA